jgi:hypothetical protein
VLAPSSSSSRLLSFAHGGVRHVATGLEDMAAAVGLGLRRSTQLLAGPLRRGGTPAKDAPEPTSKDKDAIKDTAPMKHKDVMTGKGDDAQEDDGAQEVIDAPADSKVRTEGERQTDRRMDAQTEYR